MASLAASPKGPPRFAVFLVFLWSWGALEDATVIDRGGAVEFDQWERQDLAARGRQSRKGEVIERRVGSGPRPNAKTASDGGDGGGACCWGLVWVCGVVFLVLSSRRRSG